MTIYSWEIIEAIALYVFLFWIGVRTVRKGKAGIKTGEPIFEWNGHLYIWAISKFKGKEYSEIIKAEILDTQNVQLRGRYYIMTGTVVIIVGIIGVSLLILLYFGLQN